MHSRRLWNSASARGALLLATLAASAVPVAAQTDITLNASTPSVRAGRWTVVTDSTAAGGRAIRHADACASKLSGALANPSNYFELTFNAVAGVPYRLWLHGKADRDYWGNDSVFVQFGPKRADQELLSLGSLARDNPGIMPADTEEWELPELPPGKDS